MRIEEILEQRAACSPAKTALVCGERRLSFRELDEAANRLANSLIANGVERGNRVVLFLDNCVEAVVGILAILKVGGVFVFVNGSTKPDKLAFVLDHCRASAILTDVRRLESSQQALGNSPSLHTAYVVGRYCGTDTGRIRLMQLEEILSEAGCNTARPARNGIDLDLAALIYTSGSTGRPKGVMATHLSLLSAAASIEAYLGHSDSDVILSVLPLSFSYGLFQMLVTLKTGGTLILERSFTYHYAILDRMEREGVTGFALVPTIAAILLQLRLEQYPLPRLRYLTNAAAALPQASIRKLRSVWPHVKIYSMYGQTECARISYLEPEELDRRPGSIGRGMPNQELWLVDENGQRVGPGQAGELVVRGAHVAKGYWEDTEATRKAFRPGLLPDEKVLYTGDLFRMDEEGFLYFVSRKDDIIKTRGEKVSPKEVEEVLYEFDGVVEAAVIGVPDDILGYALRAVISVRDGVQLQERDILRHCAQRLEDFMVPRSVVFVPGLPKNGNGKIDRRELATQHGSRG